MKFTASWSIPQDKWLALCERWGSMSPQDRANAGDGVKIIGSLLFSSPTTLPPYSATWDSGTPAWT